MTSNAQKKSIKKWNTSVGSTNYITFRIYRELNEKLKSMALQHHSSVNEYMALIINNYNKYITNKLENIMGKLVQNYDELLEQLANNSVVDIVDDKLYWDMQLLKEMAKININNPQLGMHLDIKMLDAFETKSGEPHFTKFAVTGVQDDDVYSGSRYITKLLAL